MFLLFRKDRQRGESISALKNPGDRSPHLCLGPINTSTFYTGN